MPEYMKVRLHLYNLIVKSDGKDLQIPPENDLCRRFGVSRVTVRGAIKGMVKDKYLIPRRGIGTFINPAMIGKGAKRLPVVGFIHGGGRNVLSPFHPEIARCVQDAGMSFETLFMPESGEPERMLEFVKSGCDAVIWAEPQDCAARHFELLAANGIPTLAIDIEREEPLFQGDSIFSNRALRGAKLARHLHSLGHRNMLFVHNYQSDHMPLTLGPGSTHHSYCSRMAELCAGGTSPETGVRTLLEFEEMLMSQSTELRRFSVIYSLSALAPHIMGALRNAGLSVPEDFSCLLYGESDPYFFNGLKPSHMAVERAMRSAVLAWLDLRLLKAVRAGTFSKLIEMDIEPGKTVRRRVENMKAGGR